MDAGHVSENTLYHPNPEFTPLKIIKIAHWWHVPFVQLSRERHTLVCLSLL